MCVGVSFLSLRHKIRERDNTNFFFTVAKGAGKERKSLTQINLSLSSFLLFKLFLKVSLPKGDLKRVFEFDFQGESR